MIAYFADWIEDQAAAGGYGGDIVVTTTLDPQLQAAVTDLHKQIDKAEHMEKERTKKLTLRQWFFKMKEEKLRENDWELPPSP